MCTNGLLSITDGVFAPYWDPNLDWSMIANGLGVEALQKGHVDAFVAPELHATMAVAAGFKVLVDLQEFELPVAGSAFLVDRV